MNLLATDPAGNFAPLIIALIVAVVIGFAVYDYSTTRKRRAELAEVARRLRLVFRPGRQGRPRGMPYDRFRLFSAGHSQGLTNLMMGPVQVGPFRGQVIAGDYHYTTGSGKNSTTHNLSFALVQLPFPGLPDMTIRQETFADRIKAAIGFDDIDFESEEFSRRFHVTCTDKKFAYDIITPRMMDYLLSKAHVPRLDMNGGVMLIAGGSPQRWRPATFGRKLGFIGRFVELWPDHVVRMLRG